MNRSPKYRADIDGLRAIAVWSVVAFHAFPTWVTGGYVGVDIFFVISGFLISTIVFQGIKDGSFDYLDFYVRRVKRIFPALIVVLLATFAAGAAITFPGEFRPIGSQIFGGASFVLNIMLLRAEGDYFQTASEFKPLLHLWSLGVEEQFYLVWPLLVAVLFRRTRHAFVIMVSLAMCSMVTSVALSELRTSHAFYSPLTRFWELFAGALLSYVRLFHPSALKRCCATNINIREVMATLGGILVLVAVCFLNIDVPFPGWRAGLPVLGAVLLISSGSSAWINSRVLSSPMLVWFGTISYPLYLWHWPLLSYLKIAFGDVGLLLRVCAVTLSVLLAWLTYKFVERPIRFGVQSRSVPLALVAAVAGIAALGIFVRFGLIPPIPLTDGERASFVEAFENSAPTYRYIVDHQLDELYRLDCDFYDFQRQVVRSSIPSTCHTTTLSPKVMIWGDSHAQSLSHGLRKALPLGTGLLQVATSGCKPAIHPMTPDPFGVCNHANEFAVSVIKSARPDVLVLAQAKWHEDTNWDEFAGVVLKLGAKNLVLVGPLPQWKTDLHKIVARVYWNSTPQRVPNQLDATVMHTNAVLYRMHTQSIRYHYVSPIDKLCDMSGCFAYVGPGKVDGLIAFDYGHLTRQGSEFVGREVLAPVIKRLIQEAP